MERDPLLDELRALPALNPPRPVELRTQEAAHAILERAASQPTSFRELFLYRALVPTLLSGLTVTYLFWAVQAASSLY